MNLNLVPSLLHLTLTKVAVALCNNLEIKALLEENRVSDSCQSLESFSAVRDNYLSMFGLSTDPLCAHFEHLIPYRDVDDDLLKRIQSRMSGKISGLNVGKPIERKLLIFIPYIALEIKKWKEDHSNFLPDGCDAQVYFCWKPVGAIDRERTAENLLKHGNLSIRSKYHLGSMYCFRNPFSSLWDSVYSSYKADVISNCPGGSQLDFWITRMGDLHFRSVFQDALYLTNVSALQYFYNACQGEDEKQAFLFDVLSKHWKNLDFVRFCVSKLCQNGYEELSSLQCHNILKCFLNWPLQNYFLNMSEYLLVKLDLDEMIDLLYDILRFSILQYEGIDYMNLLKEFWKLIPSCHKDSLMNTSDFQPIKTALKQIAAKSLTPELYQ